MIKDEVFNKCTRCGKEFTDLKVSVELGLYVERLKDTGVWEEVPNMTQESREYLCPDCFNKLCDILAQMNLPQTTGTLKHDAGVILPVEERVTEEPCKCAETKTEDTSSIRHRHESYTPAYSDDDEIVELVITSKVMENGVEVPGPDDGKIVRMTKREWRAQQEAAANQPAEEKPCDCNRTSDPDMLVDVCDDVIYG